MKTGAAPAYTVSVGYAENKENTLPSPAQFPTPWAGAPNTTFLGNPVPGSNTCGTVSFCYDAGAIRIDNPGPGPLSIDSVAVDDHSACGCGGKNFGSLWGSFTVSAGASYILTENPPTSDPTYDNFDTSGYPNNNCTPVTVAPTVTITVGGVATVYTDSTHVLDTGGIDRGYCAPPQNESTQWRRIGASGSNSATLTLGPATVTQTVTQQVTETATLLDGSGFGLPNVNVGFTVISGPDSGVGGTAVTNSSGQATFSYSGTQGEDVVMANVTTVGSLQSNTARVIWVAGSSSGFSGADIGSPTPAGSDTFTSGTWTITGGGSDIGGTADHFHFVSSSLSGNGGVAAVVASQSDTATAAKAGVMLRASADPASPYYAAFVTPGDGVVIQDRAAQGGVTTTVASIAGSAPAYLWVNGSGGAYTAYSSSDGYIWQPVAGSSVNLALGSTLLAGLAVTSHDSSQASTATMQSVLISADPPAPPPPVACPAPWTCADVGSPTPAGSQMYDPGTETWTVNGGGADISGTSDQFHYVWQSVTGDGSLSARVSSQGNSGASAKAGIMLRATTDPGSPDYAVVVTPSQGVKVQVRSTQGGTTTKVANPAGTAPVFLQVTRAGNTFTAYTSADGATWTLIPGSTATLNLPSSLLEGLAVTSHNTGTLSPVTFNDVTLGGSTGPPPPTCPTGWSCADIGAPALAGSQSLDTSTGTWTITGGGTDITGTSDQFHFVWQSLTGDGSITVHIASQGDSSASAKAGIMLRASTDPAAPYYGVVVTPAQGIKVQVRPTQGGSTTKIANPSGAAPAWLRVTRSGNTFSAYTSPDGNTWTLIASSTYTVALPSTVLQGMAVTSHNSGQLCTVVYDVVQP
ncbi:MAG: hypothetical protein JOZ92_09190 [Candidatus Dormibacteraeota bacterium]|nr:hypothetical protein [Candidatus Dormibacteraeota bacterium]